MRVLFSAPPSTGHLLPALPTLQALRAAGHDVLVAAYGADAGRYLGLGLSVTDISDGTTLAEMYEKHAPGRRTGNPGLTARQIFAAPARANAALSRNSVAPLLKLVHDWSPELLIHDPFQGAIPLVSAITKVPVIEHQSGMVSGRVLTEMIAHHLQDLYRENGVPGPPPSVSIEVAPPSLIHHDENSLHVKYVSQHGSALVPPHLLARGTRARIVITFGTVMHAATQAQRLAGLMSVLAKCDADFLLPMAVDIDDAAITSIPDNVTTLPFVPISELLRNCDAIVHHGGSGTLLSAVTSGVPQLIIPHAGDQFFNSELAHRIGFGLSLPAIDQIDSDVIKRLLNDDHLHAVAAEVQAENAAQPSPAELISRLLATMEIFSAAE